MKNWNKTQIACELQRVCKAIIPQSEQEKEYIFLLCYKLAEIHTKGCKYCNHKEDEAEFAFVVAEELYMLIVEKQYEVKDFNSFIDHMLPQYCGIWYKLKGWEKPQPKSADIYFDPDHARRISPPLVNEILDKVCTGDMIKASWDALHKYIRYYKWEDRVASRNAHLSIVMSIRRGKFVNFHLSDGDARVCRLLYNRYRLLVYDILSTVSEDVLSSNDYLENALSNIFEYNGIGED